MRRIRPFLMTVGVTAVVTGFLVFRWTNERHAAQFAQERARWMIEKARLEADLRQRPGFDQEAPGPVAGAPSADPHRSAATGPQSHGGGSPPPVAAPAEVKLPDALAPVTLPSQARDMVTYRATGSGQGSLVAIDGTSSIHDWTMEGRIIPGKFELDPKVVIDVSKDAVTGLADGKLSAKAEVAIPVRSLKSKYAKMDEIMQEHMEEKANKRIEYKLKELSYKKSERKAGEPFEFESKGDLTIHGVTKEITMPVKIANEGADKLKICGAQPLKMTDFQVKPPSPNLGVGMITTGDEIIVTFNWVVSRSE